MLITHEQVCKTNGRVTDLEKFKSYADLVINTRETTCPALGGFNKKFEKFEKEIDDVSKNIEDLTFVARHPKLFIALIVVLVLLTLATFLETNPLKVFDRFRQNNTVQVEAE